MGNLAYPASTSSSFLVDGQTVAIIGGGPAGVSCAIALRHLAQLTDRDVSVVVYEGKRFRGHLPHYNQCAGVLSPPIVSLVEQRLKVPFPHHLVQRSIAKYVLHTDRQQIELDGDGEASSALRRVQFDDYLLDKAREVGVEVVQSRVVEVERHDTGVVIYSDSDSRLVSAVIGAFGLDDGTARVFERVIGYRPPEFLPSIVTKVHPTAEALDRIGDIIHAFLPGLREIEFGAVTPKGNHLTINIAGRGVDAGAMDRFLAMPAVKHVLPQSHERDLDLGEDDFHYFKGKFPVSLAARYYADRIAIIGDAAGLIRPFKGKGVTGGICTGVALAEAMFARGISAPAFADFFRHDEYCREITDDLTYARALRWLANSSAHRGYIDVAIALARRNPRMRSALYDSISAHRPYRAIVRDTVGLRLVRDGFVELVQWALRRGE